VRRALLDAGYAGDGAPPALPDTVWETTTARYIAAYERITNMPFEPAPYPVAERLAAALAEGRLG
jgi:phosphoribosylaminoimidazole-succinocarboxamide synthase